MDVLLLIDRHAGSPVYRQIVEQIRFQAASGVLVEGCELPSTRILAASHGLNPMTVSKAYAELEREGVLVRRPGQPHLVARRPEDLVVRDREAELARVLAPAVRAACQLGLDPTRAEAVFERLLRTPLETPGGAAQGRPAKRAKRQGVSRAERSPASREEPSTPRTRERGDPT